MEKSIKFITKFALICLIGLLFQAIAEGAAYEFKHPVINYDYKYTITWMICILYQTMVLGVAFILANQKWGD